MHNNRYLLGNYLEIRSIEVIQPKCSFSSRPFFSPFASNFLVSQSSPELTLNSSFVGFHKVNFVIGLVKPSL